MKTTLILLLLFVVSSTRAWYWEPFVGNFPFYEHPDSHFGTNWHYCRVNDGTNMFTGTINEDDGVCVVARVFTAATQTFTQFDIFVVEEPTEVIAFTADINDAIPCEDQEAPDCLLGHSVFAQSVCFSVVGKVAAGRVYGVDWPSSTYQACPFMLYTHTEPPPGSGSNKDH